MDPNSHIRWLSSRFSDQSFERKYLEESWKSVRLQTAITLIGFSLAWLASLSVDILYLQGTAFFGPASGSRVVTGAIGIGGGLWLILARPLYEQRWPHILVYGWMSLSTFTAILVAWIYPFLETTADGRTDLLLSTCYWMSIQILGLGIALWAWRQAVVLMAALYASSYIIQAVYWTPQLEHSQEPQIIIIIAASVFAVVLSYLFARRSRQRFFITKLYEDAKIGAEKAKEFTTFLLAATGHDIRQPIFALNLNASLLEDLIKERDWDRAQVVAERQSQALAGVAGLISSVLELSQLDTNRRHIAPEPLLISDVIDTVVAPVEPIAADRGIKLIPVRSSVRIDADRGVVEHILANLLANAVSHSGASRVLVGAKREGEFIELLVVDDGKGLSDQPQQVTLADIQPDSDRKSQRGLGIEIMFRLAEKAGLELSLTSDPARGVVARLRTPISK